MNSNTPRKPHALISNTLPVAAMTMLLFASVPVRADVPPWPPAPPIIAPADSDPGPMPESITTQPAGSNAWQCSFSFHNKAARNVALVGSFNGWNQTAHRMTGPGGDGVWKLTVQLGSAAYEYKFLVDGTTWLPDPRNPNRAPDGFGGHNSVLKLGRLANLTRSAATAGDGKIDPIGLEHVPGRTLYRQWIDRNHLLLRYRTLTNDVQGVIIAVRGGQTVPMHTVREGPLFTHYEARIAIPTSLRPEPVEYTFVLTDGALRVSDAQTYVANVGNAAIISTPDWAEHAVWYQIMLERFRDGDPANNPTPSRRWTSEWFTPSPWEGKDGQTFYNGYVYSRHYGGDLEGLEQKLPYLKDLGINAIYLNPIFKAESHHKYDAINYVHIDDHFGTKGDYAKAVAKEDLLDPATWQWTPTDRRFLEFVKEAHKMGFRVILDGVFNHVGTSHPAFQDVRERGRKSRFADWFDVTSWEPFRYNGWAGYDGLPVFKKSAAGLASKAVKDHVFAVTRRWMDPNGDGDPSDGIDGWRLDVPQDIPAPFWVDWCRHVRSINPQAYISGEIWDQADSWLDGTRFDAVMNYRFADPAVAWIAPGQHKLKASDIDRRLADLRMAYPQQVTYVLQNLVDSHDTDRLLSMMQNPGRDYDKMNRPQSDNPSYDNSRPTPAAFKRARLVAFLQMTYVGAPMIYYGDEAGMWGADDPTDRKPMLWSDLEPYDKPEENHVAKDHLAFYNRITGLRNTHAALRTGSFQTLLTDDKADVWAFLRANGEEELIVVINCSDSARRVRIPLPTGSPQTWKPIFGTAKDLKSNESGLVVSVPATEGLVMAAQLR